VSPEDQVALRHLVDRYADAVDRRDGAALADLFCADGVLRVRTAGGSVINEWGGPDVARLLETLAGYERTFHLVGGCTFDPADDEVTGRVHCVAHHYERTSSGPVDLVMMVLYHDRYRFDRDEWRIAERVVETGWTELHPAHPVRKVAE
jgi:hypothetical protein